MIHKARRIEINDVVPDTIKITAAELRIGDIVFDRLGGRHTIIKVQINTRTVRTVRRNGSVDYIAKSQTITVQRRRETNLDGRRFRTAPKSVSL